MTKQDFQKDTTNPKKSQLSEDKSDFDNKVRYSPHGRVDPCFMTGQGCVYTEDIARELNTRNRQSSFSGFMVVPFRPNIDSFLELCLRRYIARYYSEPEEKKERRDEKIEYKVDLVRGDQVKKTGYVICGKICKKIQESNFIVADVSVPNPNVFYELGLAYGINQKIVILYHYQSEFGRDITSYFGCKGYAYQDLKQIKPEEFMISQFLWQKNNLPSIQYSFHPSIVLIEGEYKYKSPVSQKLSSNQQLSTKTETYIQAKNNRSDINIQVVDDDISLEFKTYILAAIDVAIEKILGEMDERKKEINELSDEIKEMAEKVKGNLSFNKNDNNQELDRLIQLIKKDKKEYKDKMRKHRLSNYANLIVKLRNAQIIKPRISFKEIEEQIQESYCSIIRTVGPNGDYDPMAYFWLGYCHALGKNVIPISVIKNKDDKINDLAFDIRALWHMTFVEDNPEEFVLELKEVLDQMILTNFAEWSRKIFWDEMLERRGQVSIFTGALHNKIAVREMIGDWDLRTASELTSYFASHHYRSTIESPVYAIELVREKYLVEVVDKSWEKYDESSKKEKYLAYFDEKHPEYQKRREDFLKVRNDYIEKLENILNKKNCIIIASPDVNPLTEIALGKIYNVPKTEWFGGEKKWLDAYTYKNKEKDDNKPEEANNPDIVTARKIKKEKTEVGKAELNQEVSYFKTFYEELSAAEEKRGFISLSIPSGKFIPEKFYNQMEKVEYSPFDTLAHLVIAPNPFAGQESETASSTERKYIIILNGISGPATFALTHVLTGGVSNEFVDYDQLPNSQEKSNAVDSYKNSEEPIFFDPQSQSEEILQGIIQDLKLEVNSERLESYAEKNHPERRLFAGLQYLIKVTVGPGLEQDNTTQEKESNLKILDWRRIKKWELVEPKNTPSRLISYVHQQENNSTND